MFIEMFGNVENALNFYFFFYSSFCSMYVIMHECLGLFGPQED